eukprot:1150868-Pelagomonas_calceolata.AAC.2
MEATMGKECVFWLTIGHTGVHYFSLQHYDAGMPMPDRICCFHCQKFQHFVVDACKHSALLDGRSSAQCFYPSVRGNKGLEGLCTIGTKGSVRFCTTGIGNKPVMCGGGSL